MSDTTETLPPQQEAAAPPVPIQVREHTRQRPAVAALTGRFMQHIAPAAPRMNGDAAAASFAGQDPTDPNRRPSNVLSTPRTNQQGEIPAQASPGDGSAASPDVAQLGTPTPTDEYGGLTREEYIIKELTPAETPAPQQATTVPVTNDAPIPASVAAELAEMRAFREQYSGLIPLMDNLRQNGITSPEVLERRVQADQQEAQARYQEEQTLQQKLAEKRHHLTQVMGLDDTEAEPLVNEHKENLELRLQMDRDQRLAARQQEYRQEQEQAQRQIQEHHARTQAVAQASVLYPALKTGPKDPNFGNMAFGEKVLQQYASTGLYSPEQLQTMAANIATEIEGLAKHLRTAGATDAAQKIAKTQQTAPQPVSGGGTPVTGREPHAMPTGTNFSRYFNRN